jgi:hypothetical protein
MGDRPWEISSQLLEIIAQRRCDGNVRYNTGAQSKTPDHLV